MLTFISENFLIMCIGVFGVCMALIWWLEGIEKRAEQKRYRKMTPAEREVYDKEKAQREEAELKFKQIKDTASKGGRLLGAKLKTTLGTYEPHGEPALLWVKEDRLAYVKRYVNSDRLDEVCSIPFENLLDIECSTEEKLTLTRMIAVGIFAFAFKKKTYYMAIRYYDELTRTEQISILEPDINEQQQKYINKVLAERNKYLSSKR